MYSMFKNVIFFALRNWYRIQLKSKNVTIENGTILVKVKSIGNFVRLCRNSTFKESSIGNYSYIGENCFLQNVTIGNFSSIGKNTSIVYGQHPIKTFVSTHPAFYSLRKQSGKTFVEKQKYNDFKLTKNKFSVEIGNDVWLGEGVKILEGVTIGDGAIVSSYSLVTKDIEAYTINIGFPAKQIRKRFDENIIQWLIEFQWWYKSLEWIEREAENFEDINILYKKYGNLK